LSALSKSFVTTNPAQDAARQIPPLRKERARMGHPADIKVGDVIEAFVTERIAAEAIK
jgi:hypothetical protein